jgi:hypothetical protein
MEKMENKHNNNHHHHNVPFFDLWLEVLSAPCCSEMNVGSQPPGITLEGAF